MQQARRQVSKTSDKVSNGRLLPTTVDLRSVAGRRFRHLVAAYESEIGGELTEAERATVRQAAALQLRIEQLQARIVRGEDVSADEAIRLSSEHRRLLGLLRTKAAASKPAAPAALDQYLKSKYGADVEDEAEAAS
jgi:hypothetical protein